MIDITVEPVVSSVTVRSVGAGYVPFFWNVKIFEGDIREIIFSILFFVINEK